MFLLAAFIRFHLYCVISELGRESRIRKYKEGDQTDSRGKPSFQRKIKMTDLESNLMRFLTGPSLRLISPQKPHHTQPAPFNHRP